MASQARGEYEGDISDEEEEIEIQGVRDPTLPEDWLVVEDDEGTFYFSPSTGITTNVRPDFPAPTTPAEYWRQVADPEGDMYWYNLSTDESSWETPPVVVEAQRQASKTAAQRLKEEQERQARDAAAAAAAAEAARVAQAQRAAAEAQAAATAAAAAEQARIAEEARVVEEQRLQRQRDEAEASRLAAAAAQRQRERTGSGAGGGAGAGAGAGGGGEEGVMIVVSELELLVEKQEEMREELEKARAELTDERTKASQLPRLQAQVESLQQAQHDLDLALQTERAKTAELTAEVAAKASQIAELAAAREAAEARAAAVADAADSSKAEEAAAAHKRMLEAEQARIRLEEALEQERSKGDQLVTKIAHERAEDLAARRIQAFFKQVLVDVELKDAKKGAKLAMGALSRFGSKAGLDFTGKASRASMSSLVAPLAAAAPTKPPPHVRGFLYKKGFTGLKKWQRRYYVFRKSYMSFWRSKEEYDAGFPPAQGFAIVVPRYWVQEEKNELKFSLVPKDKTDKYSCVEVDTEGFADVAEPVKMPKPKYSFQFKAVSPSARRAWCAALHDARDVAYGAERPNFCLVPEAARRKVRKWTMG